MMSAEMGRVPQSENSKFQAPSSRKAPNTKLQTTSAAGVWSLVFGASLELGAWNLVLLGSVHQHLEAAGDYFGPRALAARRFKGRLEFRAGEVNLVRGRVQRHCAGR